MNKRAEAIVARGVGIADLDDGLAPLIVALTESLSSMTTVAAAAAAKLTDAQLEKAAGE